MVKLSDKKSKTYIPEGPLKLDYPRDTARAFLASLPGRVISHQKSVFIFDGVAYRLTPEEKVKALIESWLENQTVSDKKGNLYRYPVNKDNTIRIMDQVDSLCLNGHDKAPCWLDRESEDPPANECVVLEDGILHLPTGRLIPPTDRFFAIGNLPIEWRDGEWEDCPTWREFLAGDWGPDSKEEHLLQEWFGLIMSWETKYQVFLMVSGAPRSGKGTIIRIMQQLCGDNHYPASLGTFDRSAMDEEIASSQLITIPDARKPGNIQKALEMILMITGEDHVNFNRKYKGNFRGRVSGRIAIGSNGLALFSDTSEALATRALHLSREVTHAGREDFELGNKLERELRGIFFWSLAGYRRLQARGRFDRSMQSEGARSVFAGIVNPIGAFAAQGLVIQEGEKDSFHRIFNGWKVWKQDAGVAINPRRDELIYAVVQQNRSLRADFQNGILFGASLCGELMR